MRIGILLNILCFLFTASALAQQADVGVTLVPKFQKACAEAESWNFGTFLSEDDQKLFFESIRSKKFIPTTLMKADDLRWSAKNEDQKAFHEYWVWRMLFQNGAKKAAFDGFFRVFEKDSTGTAKVFQLATVECLNNLVTQFPTFEIPFDTINSLKKLIDEGLDNRAKQIVFDFLTKILKKKILSSKSIEKEKEWFEKTDARLYWLQFVESQFKSDTIGTIKNGLALIELTEKESFKNTWILSLKDSVYLQLGRAFYEKKYFQEAVKAYRKVLPVSNLFPAALNELAWSYLMLKDYPNAVGVAQSLLLGSLRKTFAPEASSIVSMTLNETCYFVQATDSMSFFKTRYAKTHAWLEKWNKNKSMNLYSLLLTSLKAKTEVPDRVSTEWLKSPVFLSNQSEINLHVSEKNNTAELLKQVTEAKNGKKTFLVRFIETVIQKSEARTIQLRGQIEQDLVERTQYMHQQLSDVAKNMDFIEAEVLNSLSEKIIKDQMLAEHRDALQKKREAKTTRVDSSSWDWGRMPAHASEEEEVEVWEDEMGFLKMVSSNHCDEI